MLTRLTAAGAAGVAAAIAAGALSLPAAGHAVAPAHAAADCVSKKEFRAVKHGWTRTQVAQRFDTDGKRVIAAEVSEVRRYPRCGGGTSVIVNFERKAAGKPLRVTSTYW